MHERFKISPLTTQLRPVLDVVDVAKVRFERLLLDLGESGGLTLEQYRRYLVFQCHLTRNVQRAFLAVAAHPSLADRRPLREFLFNFALEEEPHSAIAREDLRALGFSESESPLDVRLWWAFFREAIETAPFLRLGATCVLENLGAGAGHTGKVLLSSAPFVNQHNSRFIQIHFHEALPHGDQILHALDAVPLAASEVAELTQGAADGALMYLRMARWALGADADQVAFEAVVAATHVRA